MKKLTILGSTGSIGRSTLDVVASNRQDFKVVALAAGRNIDILESQIRDFSPDIVAVADEHTARALSKRVNGLNVLTGEEGINSVASYEQSDFVISSIVGSAGLMPTMAAIRAGKTVGLANKETLVMAGEIVMSEARKRGVKIIPVDSEHSAVFQCIEGRKRADVRRIILTASGGPFMGKGRNELKDITASEALKHPNWSMGKKISIDSATLMNKGLEVIEACWLFDIPPENVSVLIHPQSIVHSLVEFVDRSCLAQMSVPDMRGPISYALSYPGRIGDPIPPLELDVIGSLTFRRPDHETFPCLSYAYDAIKTGGTMPCVLNASNEVAVTAFLNGRIGFNGIPSVVRKTIDSHKAGAVATLEDVMDADRWSRERAEKFVKETER
ncbi:MAG TPA: 1-deoxy-D-xylulose-5-phosphate reductoisomerase [Candidatus Sulfobium mesophilum]|jgi:1-deoxy-D-xylulose-5-phosphate reductoisomerase|uniref:1-deoxy-D-xylulose 5-phosphate reductoisomerase n=1 Tax=Candidatus Sulfobium mesophilum TaxID=2016548 RepID=A0A2U3QK10_9BACT|nr:1-deoxy-D-xylulose 5-phosphate reductoisomerase [Candidatus Sulfobium mesophilum]HSB32508.1 1-deoxy-D-xylulose-5-phosphate reductoisomerase [Candidatus Sulfobium mesophilum]